MAETTKDWDCAAYGEAAPKDWCFFNEVTDACTSAPQCSARMTVERGRVYSKLLTAAEDGDEMSAWLLTQIKGPDEILGGSSEPGR